MGFFWCSFSILSNPIILSKNVPCTKDLLLGSDSIIIVVPITPRTMSALQNEKRSMKIRVLGHLRTSFPGSSVIPTRFIRGESAAML